MKKALSIHTFGLNYKICNQLSSFNYMHIQKCLHFAFVHNVLIVGKLCFGNGDRYDELFCRNLILRGISVATR